jgi:hypothetical protein
VALRKKAKVKKCWISRHVPAYYWEDHNGSIQGRAPRGRKVQAAARDEGQ